MNILMVDYCIDLLTNTQSSVTEDGNNMAERWKSFSDFRQKKGLKFLEFINGNSDSET